MATTSVTVPSDDHAAGPTSNHGQRTAPSDLPPLVTGEGAGAEDTKSAAPQAASTPVSPTSSPTARLRSASIKLINADPPLGMWAASGSTVAQAPSINDIRRGTFHHDEGWNQERVAEQHRRRASTTSSGSSRRLSRQMSGLSMSTSKRVGTNLSQGDGAITSVREHDDERLHSQHENKDGTTGDKHAVLHVAAADGPSQAASNGYEPPPKLPWTTSTRIALLAFWKWFLTPLGFCITVYGLNVVAWGGMLFLLLCNAAPAMCHPSCSDINSPRRIWIEIDSQILNALFCVTGFGLIPWRFRDLYWLLVYRGVLTRKRDRRLRVIRMLAGIHRSWFRLAGSERWQLEGASESAEDGHDDDDDNPAVPLPLTKKLSPPLTGVRAPPTATWRMDYVIWMNVWNTFFQACLCGFMWGMNRYNRPSWSTGFFVAIASIVAGLGGIMMATEGRKVKRIEGVPPKTAQILAEAGAHIGNDGSVAIETKRSS